ncbi:hypothetical protein MP638_006626 [Amoeboaphelidium occidentale]|nr:hypothetical protein MP638_006626 [Amoeboaphelidium occidentale]
MAITLTPTPCCYNTDDYITHLLHVLEYRDEFLGFYRAMRWRRLRWRTRIKRQKAYDTLYKELAAGAEHVVIAYGGGGFSHNSRGHPPTPNKHLFLELKRRTSAGLFLSLGRANCARCVIMNWFNLISGRSSVVTIPTAGPAGIVM